MAATKTFTTASLLLAALLALRANAAPPAVDTTFPYTGPAIPVGDWVDPTVKGNGKGFQRVVEPPAVAPKSAHVTNNINVISLSYIPAGINVHYQTPFGLGVAPSLKWGSSRTSLKHVATGSSRTYDRTPSCSLAAVTQCSQFFHDVQIKNLASNTVYYYQIEAANGTTTSEVMTVHHCSEFTIGILNDMGYTNAKGTHEQLINAITDGTSFLWHGGDISYADDWYSGILPCASDWPVCYNGSSSELPGGLDNPDYLTPLPEGEIADQGGPRGGDISSIYESNWDLWQQWINIITTKVPYMVLPGNHEASCGEFDGPGNIMTAYLNDDESNTTVAESSLTYYSCPPSQSLREPLRMPGNESGGVDSFWYSFDYGLAHFISLNTETDYANSPEFPFVADLTGDETHPAEDQTFITDSGPFGAIDGSFKDNTAYEQYQWLKADLAAVDRTKTPWIVINSHRPMYSSGTASYQAHIRTAFQSLMLDAGVDVYIAGHIHWYERLFPLTINGTIDSASIVDDHTYYTNEGVSIAHIVNGMAGNIDKLTINATALKFQFVLGLNGTVADELVILKRMRQAQAE
ncbi:acid phosphatase AphA [Gymnopus androsaceus JB14]|uniref:Purple acid phosphatase n=1 Tax=Gymnopus androsaceus JB14 TaxID=1447944 RepID=A0A6A4H3H9_9AGAR|nr:acid phosphatase AphA [Gymnopus androsaceus JB14]